MSKPTPCFSSEDLTAIAKTLGDTTDGLTGGEITQILTNCGVAETTGASTKWKRVFDALAVHQNAQQAGNHVVAFINKSVNPVRHTTNPGRYAFFVDRLVPILSLSGLTINEAGKVATTKRATSLGDALARANSLKSELSRRGVHPQVLVSCRAELIANNYFHAVLEGMKGIAERMRAMSNLGSDGAELVNDMFLLGKTINPMFAINALSNDSELSEQKGFVNLLVGMFGMFRNTTAHALRLSWPMTETDALDMLTSMSLVHRKLDVATRRIP